MTDPYSHCENIKTALENCYSKTDCNKKVLELWGWNFYCKSINKPLKEKQLNESTEKCGSGFSKR